MNNKEFSCKNCGAPLSNYSQSELVRCKYCGTAFGDDQDVAPLKNENPTHEFKPRPQVEVSNFDKRTLRWAFDAVSGRLINRLVGACMPFLVIAIVIVVAVIALIAWGTWAAFGR